MNEQIATAGKVLAGKEAADRAHDNLAMRKTEVKKELVPGQADVAATTCDDEEKQEDFYNDILMRFGIEI